jgi:hypothetical protein
MSTNIIRETRPLREARAFATAGHAFRKIASGIFVAVLLSVTARAVPPTPLLKVNISGVVENQIIIGPSEGSAHFSALNTKRVFTEFGVSDVAYALVLDLNGTAAVELVPLSASSPLPTIEVFTFNTGTIVIDTKKHFVDFNASLSSTATGNLFENLDGSANGRATFKGTYPPPTFTKLSFSGVAAGSNGATVIKLKLVTTGVFTQGP